MTYRPICDTWLLARAKLRDGHKFYGAYPAGFLLRARDLLGVHINESVLHVCAGMVRHYPYAGLGPCDKTLDLDPACKPDYLQDCREPWPLACGHRNEAEHRSGPTCSGWGAVLADPPYSAEDAAHYPSGAVMLPTPTEILRRAWEVLPVGRRCGILLYGTPRQPSNSREVALVTVIVGMGNRQRTYSVWEKTACSMRRE